VRDGQNRFLAKILENLLAAPIIAALRFGNCQPVGAAFRDFFYRPAVAK
jgi:hypothetical protein